MNTKRPGAILGVGLLSALAVAQEQSTQRPRPKAVNFYSIEKEIALGRESARHFATELGKSLAIVTDPKLQSYVAKLGASLAKQADREFPYSFTLYDDRNYEARKTSALSLPLAFPADAMKGTPSEPVAIAGGSIFVPLSLLANAQSEAQFAAQLAHAIAHIFLRHTTRQATRSELINQANMPFAAQNNQSVAIPLGTLQFARAFELQADALAVEILADSGYDPSEFAQYVEQRPLDTAGNMSQVFSSHPSKAARLQTIKAELQKLPPRTYKIQTSEFEDIKSLASSIQ
jgi:predicted Zn-dependent protease